MKNRELMRLNKVIHKGEVKTIDCISPGYVSFIEDRPSEDESKFGEWVDLDEVEFIPLNKDLLHRYGFSDDSYANFTLMLPDPNKEQYLTIHFKDYGCNEYSGTGFTDYPIQPDLPYVHQLQNLYFALTGEELVIKDGI